MFFKTLYNIRDIGLNHGQPITFEEAGTEPVTIELRQSDEPLSQRDCLCTVRVEHTISARISEQFTSATTALEEYTCPDGGVPEPPQPPDAVRQESLRAINRMEDSVLRTVKLLRWRLGIPGHHSPIRSSHRAMWSFDAQTWQRVPLGGTLSVGSVWLHPIPNDALAESVRELMNAGDNEPLAHELLREAWGNQMENPRSSLLIAITAAEFAVKSFIAKLVPGAEWLIMNVPSPSISKLLREYLPKLPVKGTLGTQTAPFIPKVFLEELDIAVLLRNEVAHKGAPMKREKLQDVLYLVHDLLCVLDTLAGYTWAFGQVRYETRKLFTAPAGEAKSKPSKKRKGESPK